MTLLNLEWVNSDFRGSWFTQESGQITLRTDVWSYVRMKMFLFDSDRRETEVGRVGRGKQEQEQGRKVFVDI